MATVPPSARIDKLFMQLIIRAAKGDKEGVFRIAQKIVEEFEKGLEGEKESAGQG